MWKRKLLRDLFLPISLAAALAACSGTATPTLLSTTSTPTTAPTATFNPTNTPTRPTEKPSPTFTNEILQSPTATATPFPTSASTPIPSPTTTATPKPVEKRVNVEDARKIKNEIADHIGKKVFAVYMAWFGQSKWTEWNHWEWESPKHDPEKSVDGRRDIASEFYPLIGPYDSSDKRVMKYHIDLAKAAGLDGFTVDWNGYRDLPSTDLAFMDKNFSQMMDVAESEDFTLSILYEPKIHFIGWIPHGSRKESIEAVREDMKYALKNYGNRKNFLRAGGVPVIFLFDAARMTPTEWMDVVDGLEKEGLSVILAADNTNPDFYAAFSGLGGWPDYDGVAKNPGKVYDFHYRPLERLNKENAGKKSRFIASYVWPGFNDTGVGGWGSGSRVLDRQNGKFYEATWQASLDNKTPWITIATWNDFNEGTNIEPDKEHGYSYLAATSQYIGRFKGVTIDVSKFERITKEFTETR